MRKYKVKLEWMEEVVPTGLAPAWMVGTIAAPKQIEIDVEAESMNEAIKKAAEIANVDLEDVARIVVNGRVIKEVGDPA